MCEINLFSPAQQCQKMNKSRQYWTQPGHYKFIDRLATLWNYIASTFEKYGDIDPMGQNIILNI